MIWSTWSAKEGHNRALLVGYAYLNVHCIAYNMPPTVFSSDIEANLPCTATEWDAQTASAWTTARRYLTRKTPSFQEALQHLLSGPSTRQHSANVVSGASSLANFVLLQALIQRVFLARQLQSTPRAELREHDFDELK